MAINITADVVNILICELAFKTYDLKDIDEIQKFSSHLLQVGACCLLFACGYPPEFIQHGLCWKCDVKSQGNPDLARATRQHGQCTHGQ